MRGSTPPLLGRHAVDEFLFDTREGFCEHYAGAFVVLLRAAGIPARVVIGYQGGVYNPAGDYVLVRHSDAHAWSEVWLAGRGWLRLDLDYRHGDEVYPLHAGDTLFFDADAPHGPERLVTLPARYLSIISYPQNT